MAELDGMAWYGRYGAPTWCVAQVLPTVQRLRHELLDPQNVQLTEHLGHTRPALTEILALVVRRRGFW